MKAKVSFVCQECGYDSPQFLGKCPECGEWNTLKEIRVEAARISDFGNNISGSSNAVPTPKTLKEINYKEENRFSTGFSEVDNVLGGGIVPGSVTLLAGDPGIGKSTLLLQIALELSSRQTRVSDDARYIKPKSQTKTRSLSERLSQSNRQSAFSSSESGLPPLDNKVLYISGEESEDQIKLRAKRISKEKTNDNFLVVSSNNTNAIVELLAKTKPKLAIIDSIQTMESENLTGLSGSVGQVRYAAALFIRIAKTLGISIIMVGHVTKEGMVAGPMVLSHMVDTVLFFEGDKFTRTRILRSLKNRFGPIDEVGIFTMGNIGITEVKNPEQIFLTESLRRSAGSVITVTLEGTRALPVEIQSLVVFSKLPVPRHVATGVDPKRLEILLAVLQKHCNLPLLAMDVFMNVAGGIKLTDPGADLSICLAIFSSLRNIPLNKIVGIAEVGLLGELRSVPLLEKRAKEARKLGFKNIISFETHKSLRDVLENIGR